MAKDDVPLWAADLKAESARVGSKIDSLEKRIDQVDRRVEQLDKSAGEVTTSLDKLSGAVSLAKWLAPTLSGIVVLAAGLYIDSRAQATAEKAAKQAVRDELALHRKYAQPGAFSLDNRDKETDGFAFVWNMIKPIEPDSLVTINARTEPPIAGTLVSAELIEGGKKCRMTVLTNNPLEFERTLSRGPIPAIVEITERISN